MSGGVGGPSKWARERRDLKPRSMLFKGKGWAESSENFANFSIDDDFTLAAWVRADTLAAVNAIMYHRVPVNAGRGWLFYVDNNGFLSFSRTSGTGQSIAKRSQSAISTGVWVHVMATVFGPTLADCDLWIGNTVQTYTTLFDQVVSGVITHTNPMTIGGWFPGNAQRWDGRIAGAGVWDRQLDSTERATVFAAKNDYDALASTAPIGWFSGREGKRLELPNRAGGSMYMQPSHVWHRYSELEPT